MSSDSFSFRQFTVRQSRAAMKVGTDGVILGAWADVGEVGARILDIGTGTGLIALMAAQRNPQALIDAVEIDAESCRDAAGNFAASAWSDRLTLYGQSLADFHAGCTVRYDRIVSNPPYFVESLRSPDRARAGARHADSLPPAELLDCSAGLLAPGGRLSVILPAGAAMSFAALALRYGLYRIRSLEVCSVAGGKPLRACLEFAAEPLPPCGERIGIRSAEGGFTPEYSRLTGDFYLKM